MNVAYLIAAHNEPEHLGRLLGRILQPGAHAFVHVDAKSNVNEFEQYVSQENAHFIARRTNVKWGGWSQVAATLDLIGAARQFSAGFDRFVFLSGTHYPVRRHCLVEALLSQSSREYINCLPMPSEAAEKPIGRLTRWHFEGGYRSQGARSHAIRLSNHLLNHWPERKLPSFLRTNPIGCGSNWWALTNGAISEIDRFRSEHSDVERFYHHTLCPDESFFQTALLNSSYANRLARDFTYTDWSDPTDSPAHISPRRLDEILNPSFRLGGVYGDGPVLMARKFGNKNVRCVERIDREF